MANIKSLFTSDKLSIPGPLNVSYIPTLDGLRGAAIITVLFSHVFLGTSLQRFGFGNVGVEIFFVLSGFLITTLLLKERLKNGNISLRKFYIRRVLRILPVAYLFLAVLLLLDHIFDLNLSAGSYVASALYVKNIHLHYTGNWFTGHFWTLAVEEQFYIIFPFILVYSFKNYVRLIFIIIVAVPVLKYLGFHNVGIFYSNFLLHKLTFVLINLFEDGTAPILIGSLLAILMFKNILPAVIKGCNRYLSLLLLLAAALFRITCDDYTYVYFTTVIFAVAVACVIYLTLINPNDYLASVLQKKWAVNLGILSYSLYIWQQIFLFKQPWENLFPYAGSLFLNIPVLFWVAYLSYNFFELKFLQLKTRFK